MQKVKITFIIVGLIACSVRSPCQTQTATPTPAPQEGAVTNAPWVPPIDLSVVGPDVNFGINDLLMVNVYDSPEFSRPVRINSDGCILLPLVQKCIQAVNLRPAEVARNIAKELREEHLLNSPIISVTMAESFSRPISVGGAVNTPLTFQAPTPVTLMEAIGRAGGLTESAGPYIIVSDRSTGASVPLRRILVKELFAGIDPSANILLHGGEEVRIPETGRVFVVGDVAKPGVFNIGEGGESSVLQALSYSGGVAAFHQSKGYIYRGDNAVGKREIPVNIKGILSRKAPDIALEANDILYIPENHGQKLSVTTLEKIIGFGAATGSGILVYGSAH